MNPEIRTLSSPRPAAWRTLSDLPDDRLVELARTHDRAAFEALMRRHNRRLFRVTRTILRDADAAQDAVQEAYLRAFTKLDSYRPTGKFSAWLTRVALNEALMIRRRDRSDTVSIDDIGEELVSPSDPSATESPTADQFVEAAHARALLEHAIDALPENFRMVFVLRVVEGLDVRETAECLELNANTVRTRLFRAQRQLRGELSRRLQSESSEIFDFGAERCDHVVETVLARLPG
ncbi:MAG TPA: RNA polymerase sigma factor [Steroidobacteraceae bacterium]|jgi:RNA polymerase sigma-70 factor (ECF subfamily)|nr:RNA polymerase sigma factor [Steroidobacteraceae bacterium]